MVPRRRRRSSSAKIAELYVTEALDRVDADEAGPGEIIAVAGLPEVTIGETLADPDDPRPLPVITRRRAEPVDDDRHQHVAARRARTAASSPPARSRTASTQSWSATCRCACCPPSAPTPGRCRAAASCSSRCSSRRCAARASSSPSASRRSSRARSTARSTSRSSGVTIDVPEDYLGVVTQLLALRKGRMEQMVNHGTGWVRHRVPRAGARPHRLPHRVPHRDARHRHAAPRVRRLRAVARRAAHPPDRQRSSPTAAARRRRTR